MSLLALRGGLDTNRQPERFMGIVAAVMCRLPWQPAAQQTAITLDHSQITDDIVNKIFCRRRTAKRVLGIVGGTFRLRPWIATGEMNGPGVAAYLEFDQCLRGRNPHEDATVRL